MGNEGKKEQLRGQLQALGPKIKAQGQKRQALLKGLGEMEISKPEPHWVAQAAKVAESQCPQMQRRRLHLGAFSAGHAPKGLMVPKSAFYKKTKAIEEDGR